MIVDRLQIQCHFYFKTRYYWPDEKSTEDGGVVESGSVHVKVLNENKEKYFILSEKISTFSKSQTKDFVIYY